MNRDQVPRQHRYDLAYSWDSKDDRRIKDHADIQLRNLEKGAVLSYSHTVKAWPEDFDA
jgi:hypothetical protein